MENKELTGVLVDAVKNIIEPTTIIDTLENLYKVLNCKTIDIVHRSFDGKMYSVVCDDNALLKRPVPRASLFNTLGRAEILGNVFICKCDETGELVSLNEEEIESIMSFKQIGAIIDVDTDEIVNGANYLKVDGYEIL